MKEIWKDIKSHKRLYQISNFGRVKRLKGYHAKKERFLKPQIKKSGYLYINLWKNSQMETKTIHTIVWDTFGDKQRNGRILQIDHIDNIKTNNNIKNLQLLSMEENIRKSKKQGNNLTGASKNGKRWKSRITFSGKVFHLGMFDTAREAHIAYLIALKKQCPGKPR